MKRAADRDRKLGRKLGLGLLVALLLAAGCGRDGGSRSSGSGDAPDLETAYQEAMATGGNLVDQDPARAAEAFERATGVFPTAADAHLNLATAWLRAGRTPEAAGAASEAARLAPQDPAPRYVLGCVALREGRAEEALQRLQEAYDQDPTHAAVAFQVGRAHEALEHWPEAEGAFAEALLLDPDHPAAHYARAQTLLRLGRDAEAAAELDAHRNLPPSGGGDDPFFYERCVHTDVRVPFVVQQPGPALDVRFSDMTAAVLGDLAGAAGPVAVLDVNHRGAADLVVRSEAGWRLLWNRGGAFESGDWTVPVVGGVPSLVRVGDLDNDRFEDLVFLGRDGVQVLQMATNGVPSDITAFCGLDGVRAVSGELADLDWTGKLDLVVVEPGGSGLAVWRNLGNAQFERRSEGAPDVEPGVVSVVADDGNNDDLIDLLLGYPGKPPAWWLTQRGGGLDRAGDSDVASVPAAVAGEAGGLLAVGDLNNDLHNDRVVSDGEVVRVVFSGLTPPVALDTGPVGALAGIRLVDYDNDGWLDVLAFGDRWMLWRNEGRDGFRDVTGETGLGEWEGGSVAGVVTADFDLDGDTDWVAWLADGGLRYLRNDGGNAHGQLKLRLVGNKSNASGLGVRLELTAGRWRTSRTVDRLPVEIGVGGRERIDKLTVRWVDLAIDTVDLEVQPREVVPLIELILPTGSCPYLYVWDGRGHRFVTDLLGAAPLGLPVAEGVYIPADTEEIVRVGGTEDVGLVDGAVRLQVTEELREVLYLDEAELWVVDVPEGREAVSTSRLLPGPPFPGADVAVLGGERPLLAARTLDGRDVTDLLREEDGRRVSPSRLRIPQLRGLAEPHGVELDFGELPGDRDLALLMTGWLHFGGGKANIGASHDRELPFPFPVLEAEVADGEWVRLDVEPGAPAGKTKTLFVDLSGALPPGARRLRWRSAFEIHWDRIALMEREPAGRESLRITRVRAGRADLHWRGFSRPADLPPGWPLTPDYGVVRSSPPWRITPSGWCTRYGGVGELIGSRDDELLLMNGGDELTLDFDVAGAGPVAPGWRREYFLRLVGWDKDADFHVAHGWTVGPLPYHGMDDQAYGRDDFEGRAPSDRERAFNTRWVGPRTLERRDGLTWAVSGRR